MATANITDEELRTAFCIAEDLVNSRPLSYVSGDCGDLRPITPNHFLYGRCGAEFQIEHTSGSCPRQRWRRLQQLMDEFWSRWSREWLPTLAGRAKWQRPRPNLAVGDVVLVLQPVMPRGKFILGRVMRVFPGEDGFVRVAEVKTKDGLITRSIQKLSLVTRSNDVEPVAQGGKNGLPHPGH